MIFDKRKDYGKIRCGKEITSCENTHAEIPFILTVLHLYFLLSFIGPVARFTLNMNSQQDGWKRTK